MNHEAPAATPRAGRGRLVELAWVTLVAAVVSFAGIGSHTLWTPDEPRDAVFGKTMLVTHDWVVPRLNGQPFLEKPPLTWWLQAAAYRTFGVSDTVARVPSAACATLTLLATFLLARWLTDRASAGWLAAGALASMAEFGEDMRRAIVDPPLVLTVTLAYAGFALLLAADGRRRAAAVGGRSGTLPSPGAGQARSGARGAVGSWGATLLVVVAVSLAFMAKGMVGLGLAAGPPVAWLLATGAGFGRSRTGRAARDQAAASAAGAAAGDTDRRTWSETLRLLAPVLLVGMPVFAAFALPWAIALVHAAGWGALRECLVGNTIGRLLPTKAGVVYGHRLPFWYYLPAGIAVLLPWSLALPAVLRGDSGEAPAWAAAPRRLLLACFFLGTLLLSIAASKRTVYLVPLLPALAVPIGLWLDRLGSGQSTEPGEGEGPGGRRARWDRPTALSLLALAGLLPPVLWIAAWQASRGAFRSFPAAPLAAQLTGGLLATAAVIALAWTALLWLRCIRHLRAATTPSGAWLVLPYLALVLVYHTAIKAAIDPLKNPHDLTAAIARLDPGTRPVVSYRPSETLQGIVQFDLARQVDAVADPAELSRRLDTSPGLRLVLPLDVWAKFPQPLRARLPLVYDEQATKASPYAIAAGR